MSQASKFLQSEGDAWLERNRDKMEAQKDGDLLLRAIKEANLEPKRVLEIGCSNGWRLNEIHKLYGAECFGIEPSGKACMEARHRYPDIAVNCGTASELLYGDNEFDLVLYGFCLYLCDRNDLLKIAAEGNRVLKDGGYLGILDFFPPNHPHRVEYKHQPGMFSYKIAHANLWDSTGIYHPAIAVSEDEYYAEILMKNIAGSYPLEGL